MLIIILASYYWFFCPCISTLSEGYKAVRQNTAFIEMIIEMIIGVFFDLKTVI